MGQDAGERSALISRIGTFFLLLGALLVFLFIASDISRVDQGRIAGATQTYIIQGVQALQTRDAGAIQAGRPTPTLAFQPSNEGSNSLTYLSFFCVGAIILGLGWVLKRKSAPPPSPGKRFERIRKFQQKRREAKAKKEAPQKDKNAKKK